LRKTYRSHTWTWNTLIGTRPGASGSPTTVLRGPPLAPHSGTEGCGSAAYLGGQPNLRGLPLTVGFLLVGLVANAGAGFLEEIGYRGYVLQNLGRQLPVWLATPLTAFLFAIVVHFNNLTLFFVLVATLVGVLLAITRLGTGAIWFAIGLHWSLDASQNYFFGLGHESTPYGHSLLHLQARSGIVAPNSEDPVFLVIVLAAIVVGLVWVHHARRFRWNARLNEDGQPET
jgi:membrane protease YdiL (CAAX protease family)